MGYTTDFEGAFKLNRKLRKTDQDFLNALANTRRMKRKGMDPKYGVDGEFYVGGANDGNFGQFDNKCVVDCNTPPKTQPGLWCQWVPSEDGKTIVWDGNEKFYKYVEWLTYIIDKILKPRGYVLNGEVYWSGEEQGDVGFIVVQNNVVKKKNAIITWKD